MVLAYNRQLKIMMDRAAPWLVMLDPIVYACTLNHAMRFNADGTHSGCYRRTNCDIKYLMQVEDALKACIRGFSRPPPKREGGMMRLAETAVLMSLLGLRLPHDHYDRINHMGTCRDFSMISGGISTSRRQRSSFVLCLGAGPAVYTRPVMYMDVSTRP